MNQLNERQQVYLRKIGLSKSAVALYELLLEKGCLTAQEAAADMQVLSSAEYRLFYELEKRELVRRLVGRPIKFQVLPLQDGLQASLADQERQLQALLNAPTNPTDGLASILVGRQKVYEVYAHYAGQATDQICIYAIGIAYNDELARTQAQAIERGVNIRHAVQEVRAANYYVISRWLKLGVDLRILKRARGYHLNIIDDTCAVVTFSNPADTEERVSMLTTNKEIIAIFQAQFEEIWQQAQIIPVELLG